MLKFENYQFLVKIFTNTKRCQLWNNLKTRLYLTEQNIGKFLPENVRPKPRTVDLILLFFVVDLTYPTEIISSNTRMVINLLALELFFFILAHPVYKMWIIQEPNTLDLWIKLHFEDEKTESIYNV